METFPGLVYPLLGKLLSEGLIEEVDKGYKITPKGEKAFDDYKSAHGEFEQRFSPLIRLALFGRFAAQEFGEQVIGFSTSCEFPYQRA